MSSRRRMLLLALAAAVLTGLCWLPFGFAPLLPVTLAVALRGLRLARTGREALLFGLVFGAVRQGVGAYYVLTLTSYSLLAPVLLLLDMAYMAPYGMLEAWGSYRLERRTGVSRTWGMVLIFPLLTWVRTLTDMSQPTDMLANAFGTNPQWLAVTGWTGPYFVSLVAVLAAALIDAAWERRRDVRRAVASAATAVAIWLALPAADLFVDHEADAASGTTLRIGLVQPSVSVRDKLDKEKWPATWAELEQLTLRAAEGADLVLWPESARPGWLVVEDTEPFADPPVEELARKAGAPILYGCQIAMVHEGSVQAAYNGAALARPDGTRGDWYGKQRLIPFVEGVPFADALGWDPATRERQKKSASHGYLSLMGNLSPGPRATVFEVGDARIGVLICYEGLYPHLVRRYREAGVNALAVLTNDGWFGRTAFPRWHALMVASRAREAGVPVVRAANTGVCSLTDRFGRMRAHTELMDVTTLHVSLTPSPVGPTPYVKAGDVLVWLLWAALIGLVIRGRRGPAPPATEARATAEARRHPGKAGARRRQGARS